MVPLVSPQYHLCPDKGHTALKSWITLGLDAKTAVKFHIGLLIELVSFCENFWTVLFWSLKESAPIGRGSSSFSGIFVNPINFFLIHSTFRSIAMAFTVEGFYIFSANTFALIVTLPSHSSVPWSLQPGGHDCDVLIHDEPLVQVALGSFNIFADISDITSRNCHRKPFASSFTS